MEIKWDDSYTPSVHLFFPNSLEAVKQDGFVISIMPTVLAALRLSSYPVIVAFR
eukprot:gene798-246_t